MINTQPTPPKAINPSQTRKSMENISIRIVKNRRLKEATRTACKVDFFSKLKESAKHESSYHS